MEYRKRNSFWALDILSVHYLGLLIKHLTHKKAELITFVIMIVVFLYGCIIIDVLSVVYNS